MSQTFEDRFKLVDDEVLLHRLRKAWDSRQPEIDALTEQVKTLTEDNQKLREALKIPRNLLNKYETAVEKAYGAGALKQLKNSEAEIGRHFIKAQAALEVK